MAIPFYRRGSRGRRRSGESEESNNNNNNNLNPNQQVDSRSSSEDSSGKCETVSSFVEQLVREIANAYSSSSSPSTSTSTRNRGEDSTPRLSQFVPQQLPDVVCCHAEANNPNRLSPHRHELPPFPQEQSTNPDHHQLSPRRTTHPSSTYEDVNSELALDVKMHIDYVYQRIGRDLRQIADNFEMNHSQRPRRRRHPAGNNNTNNGTNLKLEFAVKVIIPMTLMGLGVAYMLKRK